MNSIFKLPNYTKQRKEDHIALTKKIHCNVIEFGLSSTLQKLDKYFVF